MGNNISLKRAVSGKNSAVSTTTLNVDEGVTFRCSQKATLHNRRWLSLYIFLLGPFLGLFETCITNLVAPTLEHRFHASLGEVEFLIAGYGLSYALLLTTGGRLGDLYGRKRIFLTGMFSFAMASLACGLAPSPEILSCLRIVQGGTAALMFPQALAFAQQEFSENEKRFAFASYGFVVGMGAVAGQFCGGLILDHDLFHMGWRGIFFVNVPIALLVCWAGAVILRESPPKQETTFDLSGAILLSISLFLIIAPLSIFKGYLGSVAGWISILAGIGFLYPFVQNEIALIRKNQTPLLHPVLFSQPAFCAGLGALAAYYIGQNSMMLTLSIYLQGALHLTPGGAAYYLVFWPLAYTVGSLTSPKLTALLGSRALYFGTILVGIGLIGLLAYALLNTPTQVELIISILVYGLGRGLVTSLLYKLALSKTPTGYAGAASGAASTMQQVANALGVAILGLVIFAPISVSASVEAFNHMLTMSSLCNIVLIVVTFLLIRVAQMNKAAT